MAEQTVTTKETKKKFRIPLWAKTLLVMFLSVATVSAVAIILSSNIFRTITRNHYMEHAVELADTLGVFVDLDDVKAVKNATEAKYNSIPESEKVENSDWGSPEWDAYVAKFNDIVAMPEYTRLFNQISTFHSKNEAKYTCLMYADLTNNRVVYLVDDAPEDERCLPGSFDAFTEHDMEIHKNIDAGFTPEITNMPEYGYLVATARPIYDETHTVVSFSMVDISMDEIVNKEGVEIRNMSIVVGSVGVAAIVLGYVLVLTLAVRPIRKLTKAALDYTAEGHDGADKRFNNLKIRTKDEIEDLSDSMKAMENSISDKMKELIELNTELANSQKEAERMKAIATKDSLTGVRSKTAYDFEVRNIEKALSENQIVNFGIAMIDLNFLKTTNDEFGHDAGDAALIKLSQIICGTFAHSKVFRIGGDEFVVIVQDDDYRISNKLINTFKERIARTIRDKSLPEYERISAAIGYSTFDESKDKCVDDVFRRADKAMYDNKHEMKEE